ncbi:hypothetical protein T02_668 [Trichinella nativa]|uniref:Uncharacterized protein n=1 Tax=Trichinella nativa TaxID=6335 RepID=A0A0V1KV31_9BILA|nr:hypothetical protein T02_668 [Trichinella nativa]
MLEVLYSRGQNCSLYLLKIHKLRKDPNELELFSPSCILCKNLKLSKVQYLKSEQLESINGFLDHHVEKLKVLYFLNISLKK